MRGEKRSEDFIKPDPNQRYNATVKLFGQENEKHFYNVLSVGLDKDGRVLAIGDDKRTDVFPFDNVEYYNFTKI